MDRDVRESRAVQLDAQPFPEALAETGEPPSEPVRPEGGRSDQHHGVIMAVGTALGVSLGAAIGMLKDNLALWMGISLAIGVGLGALIDAVIYGRRVSGP